ncbi:tyrosine-type recombinase/integrase [Vogesella sp. LYT5W]|uniref:Tyrosine-type recombinase/integrase n=1 Tax=Vogesella margarita TaxID=2984199 RepID=A0ABT5IQK9_9NEIS|nr:tyrosine-type recombinase/integrase [Vogesella margarita]MDC7714832.1 tyrosine-type recombinase/integrase [Vogesella margarita]
MSKNIERRGNTWFATLHVPEDVRHIIGKSKFFKTLKTTDKRIAETRAAPIIASWKAQIQAARGVSDPFLEEALRLRRVIETAPVGADPGQYSKHDLELEAAQQIANQITKEEAERKLFLDIAIGNQTLLSNFYDEWATHLTQAPKTIDQMKKDVKLMVDHFKTIERIDKAAVLEWVRELMAGSPERKPYTYSSLERIFTFSRSFWGYLQDIGKADLERQPFTLPNFAKRGTAKSNGTSKGRDGWIPFEPAEVVALLNAAIEKRDHQLADLIRLGMYTGGRIEELCSLKADDCSEAVLKVTDSKTEAGLREVPVHSMLVDVVKRLKEASTDGYLISGLSFNKYNDRSNAIGKRFGRLKKSLGFPDKKVFHSIRKTLVTLLENEGISENLAADIVGHEKPRITYGLYSGGATLAVKKEALERVRYPFQFSPKYPD